MSDGIEWLCSRRHVCKGDLYSPVGHQDHDRNVVRPKMIPPKERKELVYGDRCPRAQGRLMEGDTGISVSKQAK